MWVTIAALLTQQNIIMNKNLEVLEELFTDRDEVDAGDLVQLLSPYVRIRKEDDRIVFLDEGHRATVRKKVILFLLAKKVLFLLGKAETEFIAPKEIISETKLSRGSVLPAMMKLKNDFVSAVEGKYYIPNHKIVKLKDSNELHYEQNK